ncbi:MAG: DNA primase catalytic subunit PriS [Pyrobaculum sp.]
MIVEIFFRNFYRNYAKLEIEDVERREFAIQPFKGGMTRHKAFRTLEELKRFVVEKTPRHLYHSTAYYQNPGGEDMEAKGWLGADLVFDIDGDHLDTEACRDEVISLRCLEDAKEEANKLVDVLTQELDLRPWKVVFSGNRGFHIHVRDREVATLGQRERRELVNFLKAVGFDPQQFVKKVGKKKAALYEEEPVGSLIRVRKGVENLADMRVEVDEVVTQDIHRLIRTPGSLNGKTGLVALPLDVRDLEKDVDKIVERAVAFRKGYLKIRFKKSIRGMALFERVEAGEGDVRSLPAHLAIYLELQGFGEIYD